jgi:hypothetical protein
LLSTLTGLLVRLLVLLVRLLLSAALLAATLAALLILLSALVFIVLGHSYLQMLVSIACHHSTNLFYLSHIAANARDLKKKLDHGCRRVPFDQKRGMSMSWKIWWFGIFETSRAACLLDSFVFTYSLVHTKVPSCIATTSDRISRDTRTSLLAGGLTVFDDLSF